MTLRGLKAGTVDVDIIVDSRRLFETLKSGLLQIGFSIDEQLHDIAVYQQAMMVFLKESSRVDVFIKTICGMLDFTDDMRTRAKAYRHYDKLAVTLAANEDIFLLKSLAGREKDLPDCHALSQTGLRWHLIINECVCQHRPDSKWVFWLFNRYAVWKIASIHMFMSKARFLRFAASTGRSVPRISWMALPRIKSVRTFQRDCKRTC